MSYETLRARYAEAVRALDRVDTELLHALVALIPGFDYHRLSCDESDWDGVSLELYGVTPVGLTLSEEQLADVWKMGFTVVRLYYEAPDGSAPRDGITVSMSGDWWAVKGRPVRSCSHSAAQKVAQKKGGTE